MKIPKRPTKKQLREIVECYGALLPGWKCIKGNRLERSCGPIVQQIGFEVLSSGAYRPMAVIWALPLPSVSMLPQFLTKYQAALLREHATYWRRMAAEMVEQFQPPILKPIDLRHVLELCQKEARESRESTNDLCMLAILHAYLGEKDAAIACCDRMQLVNPPDLAPRLDWEERHKEFGRQLRKALEAGEERVFLDTAAANAKELT